MFFILLCFHVVVQGLSEEPPAPPHNMHVDNWLLTWTPTPEVTDVTYTVQYARFDEWEDGPGGKNNIPVWRNVTSCVRTSLNSCDVSFTKAEAEFGCVMLRVRAERHGLTSEPVNACSRYGDSCTPDVSVTVRPGSFTVHLSKDHNLYQKHADHAKHRVYFGKAGEPLEEYDDTVSSLSINELEEGQRYCTRVQYVYYGKPVGLSSCPVCEVIPASTGKQTQIIVPVVVVVLLVVVIPLIAYILIFHRERIKQLLRPPYEIPDNFLEPIPERRVPLYISIPSEENYDRISLIIPAVRRD